MKPPILVYLDLNHWIALAKAKNEHPDGRQHLPALTACRQAVTAGDALFPLSGAHYVELARIADPRQRDAIADVMEELSQFATLLPRDYILRYELDSYLTGRLGPRREPLMPLPLVGFGSGWAFGRRGGLSLRSVDGRDVTQSVRAEWTGGPDGFDGLLQELTRRFERRILTGPSDEAIDGLRELGYRPEVVDEMIAKRVNEERGQYERFDEAPQWRRGRLRDVIIAREVIIELTPLVEEELIARGRNFDDIWHDAEDARSMDALPSLDVAVTLKTAAHRNRDKSWQRNDIHDIDALSLAVPYCDVVVTEKHAHHVLHTNGVPERMDTVVLRRLSELPAHLIT